MLFCVLSPKEMPWELKSCRGIYVPWAPSRTKGPWEARKKEDKCWLWEIGCWCKNQESHRHMWTQDVMFKWVGFLKSLYREIGFPNTLASLLMLSRDSSTCMDNHSHKQKSKWSQLILRPKLRSLACPKDISRSERGSWIAPCRPCRT